MKTHVKNPIHLLDARNRTHVVAIGFRTGLLSPDEVSAVADAPEVAAQKTRAG